MTSKAVSGGGDDLFVGWELAADMSLKNVEVWWDSVTGGDDWGFEGGELTGKEKEEVSSNW